ncbi:MAG: histidine kinase, partial [Cyanobacteria bacterium P01_F01_bin.143]
SIEVQQGILVQREPNIYYFSHLTLQEYLTAQYIVDNQLIEKSVNSYVTHKHWFEVFLLISQLMKGKNGSDELLLLMEKKASTYQRTSIGEQWLVPILQWSNKMTLHSKGCTESESAKRAVASVILLLYAYAFNYKQTTPYAYKLSYESLKTTSFNGYAKTLAQFQSNSNAFANARIFSDNFLIVALNDLLEDIYQLENLEIFDEERVDFPFFIDKLKELKNEVKLSKKIAKNHEEISLDQRKIDFTKKIIDAWLKAFDINPKIVIISASELEEIDNNYFYINWLMFQCRDVALTYSKNVWNGIESRMLKVSED